MKTLTALLGYLSIQYVPSECEFESILIFSAKLIYKNQGTQLIQAIQTIC